jgi:hypothetical protein
MTPFPTPTVLQMKGGSLKTELPGQNGNFYMHVHKGTYFQQKWIFEIAFGSPVKFYTGAAPLNSSTNLTAVILQTVAMAPDLTGVIEIVPGNYVELLFSLLTHAKPIPIFDFCYFPCPFVHESFHNSYYRVICLYSA